MRVTQALLPAPPARGDKEMDQPLTEDGCRQNICHQHNLFSCSSKEIRQKLRRIYTAEHFPVVKVNELGCQQG